MILDSLSIKYHNIIKNGEIKLKHKDFFIFKMARSINFINYNDNLKNNLIFF